MSTAVITIRDSGDSSELTTVPLGVVDPGSESAELTIRIWNNYGGVGAVDDATNCVLTIKTYDGLNTGDTVPHGQEVVTETMIEAKCTTRGDSSFTPIGGATTLPIGNGVGSQTLSGAVSTPANQVCTVVVKVNVPADATPAAINLNFAVLYV